MTVTLPPVVAPLWWNAYAVVTVELGTGTAGTVAKRGQWDRAHWDRTLTGNWSGLEPAWESADPCRVLDVTIERGRGRWFERYGASSCTVTVDDRDGALSWDQDDDEHLAVQPGVPLRVQALDVSTGYTVTLWRGFLESVEDAFVPLEQPHAKLGAQDALAQVAHVDMPEQAPIGAGELAGARVNRLLTLADWPVEWRDVDAGVVTMQATNLARNIVDDLGITADSEGGALFALRDGRVAFRDRDWLRTNPRSTTVQATIGDDNDDVCATSYELVRSGNDVVNDVQLARAGGTVRRFVDDDSVSVYRRRTYQRTDYVCEDDAQIDVLGHRMLAGRARGQVRIARLTIACVNAPTFAFVLDVDYGDLLVVNYRPPPAEAAAGVQPFSRTVLVQGVAHAITPDGWTCTLRVDDAIASAADTWDGGNGWDRALWTEAL